MAIPFLYNTYFAAKVGIGTASPSDTLTVVGDVRVTGILKLASGSAGAPSLAHRSDENTGLFFPANDNIGFTTSNTERMRIDSSGNVGIGTNNPGSTLTISGPSSNQFQIINSANSKAWRPNVNGNDFYITESGVSNPFVIQAGGNVGIGTTSPTAKLQVSGKSFFTNDIFTLQNKGIFFNGLDDFSSGIAGIDSGTSVRIFAGGSEKVRVKSTGNVGIGTTSPSAKLHVVSTVEEVLRIDSGTTGAIHFFEGTTRRGILGYSNGSSIAGGADAGDMVLRSESTKKLHLSNAGAVALTVDVNENVGIGVTSPSFKLDVQGTGGPRIRVKETTDDTLNALVEVENSSGNAGMLGVGGSNRTDILDNKGFVLAQTGLDGLVLLTEGSDPIIFATGGIATSNEKMRIRNTGGISFGSTGTAYGTSGQILKSNGDASPTWIDGSAIPGVPGGSGTLNTVAMWTPDGDTLGDGPITFSGNNSTFAGSVLIGTNISSSIPLVVQETTASGFAIGFIRNTNTTDGNGLVIDVNSTGGAYIQDWRQAGSVKMRLLQNGRLGIGVTLPGYELDVGGEGNFSSYLNVGSSTGIRSTGWVHLHRFATNLSVSVGNNGTNVNLYIPNGVIFLKSALLSNQENTDVDTGTETVAEVSTAAFTAAFFDFVIKKTTNVRSGTVYACHDGTTVQFTETSTQDLGDTSDVTLSVDISGGNMRLRATTTSDDWSIKSLIRAI